MSLDVRALLEQTGALLTGHFRLSSGLHSANYVQCALLLEDPRNAKAIGGALGGVIIGYTVAEALGLPFVFTERKEGAMTLRRGFRLHDGERVVIVEDVVTTGKSTRETARVIAQQGGTVVGFASILNRSGRANPFEPEPYEALLELDFATYEDGACPHCADRIPLDAPGSRYSK